MRTRANLAACMSAALLCAMGCETPEVAVPDSLAGPREIAVSRGEVCMDLIDLSADGSGLFEPRMLACSELADERVDALTPDSDTTEADVRDFFSRGAIGLVANEASDRVSVIDMSRRDPRLIDLDVSAPGITQITVGRRPTHVETSLDGTVAYVTNELDKTLSVIDVWALQPLSEAIALDSAPVDLSVSATGVTVALAPNVLAFHPGVRCEQPSNLGDRRTYVPDGDCSGQETAFTSVTLPGTVTSVVADPRRPLAYATYSDKGYLSVVALEDAGETCLNGGEVPCEIARVGVTTECADGIDNDGDGQIDTADTQCFGPLHAESVGGIGRRLMGDCADGLDNDGDGLADRLDPECLSSSQAGEDARPDFITPQRPCDDNVDNDGDQFVDFPGDSSCYGPQGRLEGDLVTPNLIDVDVDELGVFLYALDAATREVVVVDLTSRTLVDAPRAGDVPVAFQETPGIQLGRTSSPSTVTGRVNRAILSEDSERAVVRYELGAYVGADNGFVYYVESASVYCGIELSGELPSTDDLFAGAGELDAFDESDCLVVPALNGRDTTAEPRSCASVIACQECVGTNDSAEDCAPCQNLEFDAEESIDFCRLGDRVTEIGNVTQTFNTKMVVKDAIAASASLSARAICSQPDALVSEMTSYLENNPEERALLGCGSRLMPQPLSERIATDGELAEDDFIDARRFDLLEVRERAFVRNDESQLIEVQNVSSHDYRLRNESWFVTYEGVIPGTPQTDGLLVEGDTSLFDVGGLDVCAAGVRPGDLLVLDAQELIAASGASCGAFELPDAENTEFLTYEILEVVAGRLTIGVTGQDGFVTELPDASCFPGGISYSVRAGGQWLVHGEDSGAASPFLEVDGLCLRRDDARGGAIDSRVNTGEHYRGPSLSFKLYEGKVAPVRDLSFELFVVRNFASASLENGAQLQLQTARPSQVFYANLPNGRFVFSPDPSDNVIYTANLSKGDPPYLLR